MTEENKDDAFEAWGLLELFGHQKLAGKLTEQTIGGCHFIRIDVPCCGDQVAYTRFFTQGAIYSMTPTTEDIARRMADRLRAAPVQAYQLAERQIEHVASVIDNDEDNDESPF